MRIRLDGLLGNGEAYRATDVWADRQLEDSFQPGELHVGLRTRGSTNPVIKLLKGLKMPYEQYLDPLLEGPSNEGAEYQTHESQVRPHAEGRGMSAQPKFGEPLRGVHGGVHGGMQPRFQGRGRSGGQFPRDPVSPQPPRNNPQFGYQFGPPYQPAFRPAPPAAFDPYMPMGPRMGSPFVPQEMEEERMHYQRRGPRGEWGEGLEGAIPASPFRRAQPAEGFRRDPLEERIAAIEESRKIEMGRSAMSSELRRMQSAVSPFDHPGVYAHIDEMVTMHELPTTWGKPLQVSGAAGNVLIADNVKLAFLKDAIWEFTKRKCAEGGEVLTEKQIRDIEARARPWNSMGKQRVEAKKILEKARINPAQGKK
jgi:hypothetical protein